ncbi:hypothetical protein D3C80_1554090 [compost metagenome]
MLERRAAVKPYAGHAHHGEFDGDHITRLARRVITGGLVNRHHAAVGEGCGVEVRRLLGIIVVPEANRILGSHGVAP